MKLLLENWREYLAEQETGEPLLGAYATFEPGYTIELSLVNLSFIRAQLAKANSVDDFVAQLNNKELYDKAVIGYITALSNRVLAKTGVTGVCANTYSVRRAVGRGYGEKLYNALFGFAALKNLYITADRKSVSKGARKRWAKIDAQTDDEVPSNTDPYLGVFDDFNDTQTKPIDDDCLVHGEETLDKGYKDEKQVDSFKKLEYNLHNFFEKEIEPMFDDPGFFGKIFGNTPENKAAKLKSRLLKLGRRRFHDYELAALKNLELQ